MDYTTKMKWVRALLSGDYQKGQFTLRRESKEGTVTHCCLGVLCEIVPDLAHYQDPEEHDGRTFLTLYGHNENAFNDREFENLGIPPEVGANLIRFNDDEVEPKSFEFIAGYIMAAVPVTPYPQED